MAGRLKASSNFADSLKGQGEATGTAYAGTGFLNLNFKIYPPEGELAKQQQNFVLHGGGATLVVHSNFSSTPDGNYLFITLDNFFVRCQ
jgi:hypothetical protein